VENFRQPPLTHQIFCTYSFQRLVVAHETSSPEAVRFASQAIRGSEKVGHQGGSLSGIGSICFSKLGAHPLLLQAELEPEHEED